MTTWTGQTRFTGLTWVTATQPWSFYTQTWVQSLQTYWTNLLKP